MGFSEYPNRVEVIFALYPYLGYFYFTHIVENHFGNIFASHSGDLVQIPVARELSR